jgi:bacillolysin
MKKIYAFIILAFLLATTNIYAQSKEKKRILKPSIQKNLPESNKVNGADANSKEHRYKGSSMPIQEKAKLKVKRTSEGHPLFIEGNPKKRKANLNTKESTLQSCYEYLDDISSSTNITASSDFSIINISDDVQGHKHVKMQQKFMGVPIHGAEVIVHFKNGEPCLFNGRYHVNTGIADVAPVYGSAYAIDKAIKDISGITSYIQFNPDQQALLDYIAPGSELMIYNEQETSKFSLAWHITIRPNLLELWDYFIDAKTGEIIRKSNQTCSSGPQTTASTDLNSQTQTLHTYLDASTYYMIDASKGMYSAANSTIPNNPMGAIWTLDAQNTDLTSVVQITSSNNTWSQVATSAHYNAGVCYDYYLATHNRNSLDGNGGTIISVINVTSGGQPMDNAYWNGKFMAYGNGNVYFKPLAGGLDVAAHEMTHGVVSNTANLEYLGQSGAINESMADIFGCMVDRDDWKIGDDVSNISTFPTGALRDLSDPHNGGTALGDHGWQPKIMSEYYSGSSDNGGVHMNSGIPNYAFYLFATSAGMDKNKAEQIYYKALNSYLVKSSQFIDLRLAVIQAATDLYGAGEIAAAKAAFDAVEIFDGAGGNYQNNVPSHTASGGDYMLFRSTDSNDPNYLYLADLSAGTAVPMSNIPCSEKPSVTDDGSTAYFTDISGNIQKISLTPGSVNPSVAISSIDWFNVAVSKDGSKLAAVSNYQDSAIYVYEFATTTWTKFHLYNPTFTTGISTDGPIYADAMEWDYTGEYIIYDCFNSLPNGSDSISYWDIGILKAWDNNSNQPGTGTIEKVFTNLPEGISVGNPTFAKNSPYIIAFDYIDETTAPTNYSVYAYNIQTGDLAVVYYNFTLGYPSFSPDDSQLAFTTIALFNPGPFQSYAIAIAVDSLQPDKISPKGSVSVLSNPYNVVPIWFAKGSRVTGTVNGKLNSFKTSIYPNPAEDQFHLSYTLTNSNKVEITLVNAMGQTVQTLLSDSQGPGIHDFDFSIANLNSGSYLLKIMSGEECSISKIVKIK